MVLFERLMVTKQDLFIIVTQYVNMATKEPFKYSLYFGFRRSQLKNKVGDLIFFIVGK